MKKTVRIIAIILIVLTGTSSILYIRSSSLPYNSEGNYFDEKSLLVYHQQEAEFLGIVTMLLVMSSIVFSYLAIKKYN